MSGQLIVSGRGSGASREPALPALIDEAGAGARFAWDEFFAIHNENTKLVYRHAVERFLAWCGQQGLLLNLIMPGHVSDYIKGLTHQKTGKPTSDETRSLYLSAIRHFFDVLEQRHAVLLNPARSVRGPKISGNDGKTAPLPESAVPELLASIDTGCVVGLRDRAIVGVLLYTAARRGAVSKLRLKDYWTDSVQWFLRFAEKGGKERNIPVRYDLQQWLDAYLDAAVIAVDEPASPLFRGAVYRSGKLGGNGLQPAAISKLVKRRFKDAGLPEGVFKAHSFRATTITNLLGQELPLEAVQDLVGHADPRTTRRYDHSGKKITRNLVERISFGPTPSSAGFRDRN